MNKEEYSDHELRVRVFEMLSKQINGKMNAIIVLTLSGLLIPFFIKYFGV